MFDILLSVIRRDKFNIFIFFFFSFVRFVMKEFNRCMGERVHLKVQINYFVRTGYDCQINGYFCIISTPLAQRDALKRCNISFHSIMLAHMLEWIERSG